MHQPPSRNITLAMSGQMDNNINTKYVGTENQTILSEWSVDLILTAIL